MSLTSSSLTSTTSAQSLVLAGEANTMPKADEASFSTHTSASSSSPKSVPNSVAQQLIDWTQQSFSAKLDFIKKVAWLPMTDEIYATYAKLWASLSAPEKQKAEALLLEMQPLDKLQAMKEKLDETIALKKAQSAAINASQATTPFDSVKQMCDTTQLNLDITNLTAKSQSLTLLIVKKEFEQLKSIFAGLTSTFSY